MDTPEDKSAPRGRMNSPDSIKAGAQGHASHSPRPERKAPKKITETYLHNAGLYYLQRYAASTAKFRTIMERKISNSCRHHTDQDAGQCKTLLDALVEKFVRAGLLNDTGYAQGMVASLRRRGLSQRAILTKLQARGLSEAQIKDALDVFNAENETDPRTLELAGAMKLARRKKWGPYANGVEFDRNKALSAFARAGFSFEISKEVLAMDEEEDPFL